MHTIKLNRLRDARDVNNRHTLLYLATFTEPHEKIHIDLPALTDSDVHEGLRIRSGVTDYRIPDVIVLNKNIGCFKLFRSEGF